MKRKGYVNIIVPYARKDRVEEIYRTVHHYESLTDARKVAKLYPDNRVYRVYISSEGFVTGYKEF